MTRYSTYCMYSSYPSSTHRQQVRNQSKTNPRLTKQNPFLSSQNKIRSKTNHQNKTMIKTTTIVLLSALSLANARLGNRQLQTAIPTAPPTASPTSKTWVLSNALISVRKLSSTQLLTRLLSVTWPVSASPSS